MTDSKKRGLPGWIDPSMQQQNEWRDQDMLISVPITIGRPGR